jgi:glycine oxidase
MPAQEGADQPLGARVQAMSEQLSETRSTARYDALVVGAGVIGLAIARRLVRSGLRALLLEAGEVAGEATGVAAGMLAPVTEADFGEEPLIELNLAAARGYREFIAELESETGAVTGYRRTGTITIALDRDQAEELQRLHEFQRSLGLAAEWLAGRDCRRIEPGLSTRAVGGILAPEDHQVSPRALSAALRDSLERSGGGLRTHARVESLIIEAGAVKGVALESGERIYSQLVVVAAGARSGDLGPAGLGPPVRPVKGQILRLGGASSRPPVEYVIRTPDVYVVPRADGRLVVGATVEERGFDRSVTAGGVLELLRRAYEVLPGITELELLEASAGLRPGTPDNAPVVGESDAISGLVWATGHWRNGVLLAPLTADAVADLATGEGLPESFRPFTPARFAQAAVTIEGGSR